MSPLGTAQKPTVRSRAAAVLYHAVVQSSASDIGSLKIIRLGGSREKEAHFMREMFDDTPDEDVKRWCDNLKHVRLYKGRHMRMANEGDSFVVAFSYGNEGELRTILKCLHVDTFDRIGTNSDENPFATFQFVPSVDFRNWTPYVKKLDVIIHPDFGDRENFDAVSFSARIFEYRVLVTLGAWNCNFANESDYRNACYLDKIVERCAAFIVDPPIDDYYCVCPKYYPRFWHETS